MSNLLLVSTLQSKLDEGKCLGSPAGNRPDDAEVQLEAVHRTLLQHEDEVRVGRALWECPLTAPCLLVASPALLCRGQDIQAIQFVDLSLLCTLCNFNISMWIIGQ